FSSVRVEGNDLDGRFVQIRGSDPDEVNVYVDGVLINNLGFNNSADLTIVPTESIEKLEVLKGANLTLLGRGAFGGVVNINTKRRFNRSIGLQMKRGSFENRYLLSEINWPLSSKLYINYFGQINSFIPEIEYFPGESFSDKTPATSIKTAKQNHSLNLNYFTHGGIINAKFIGYFLDYTKPFWESNRKNYLLAFSYKGALLGMKDFDFVWNVFRSDAQLKRNPAGSANFFSGYQTSRMNIKFAKKFLLKGFEIHTLGEYFHDELDSDLKVEDQNYSNTLYNALLYENRGSIGAVFAHSDFIESIQGLSWRTFLGMRADFVSSGNNEFLPTVGFQLDWKKTLWSLSPYVNYGKNVKYPTLFENAYLRDITTTSHGDTLFKRLEPEYNNSAELGMKISYKSGGDIFRQMDIAIAIFSSTVYNKLLKRPFDDLMASAQTGRNVTRGFEASVKFNRVLNYFQLFAGYTGLNIEDPFLYPYKPDERVSSQLDFSLPVGFYLTQRYFYEGKSSAWFYDLDNNFQTVEITPFYDIDLAFGYRFNISRLNFNLQFAGYNLLDNAGFQYYYLKKRYLQVSFSVKFL
ncbi:MAG: TonB-dependent receptor plug domain-containing protein, partial [Calditrichia bacterium]